ncbi:TPR repeat protein [Thecamonas trahens ATCC 50062]|uniref:TPR repeat protein n=1 Tax=Thecamonas trahens ATCC 50062 TaxID=461836 RepID=A0A0L0DAG5_THETB|nr:TPR repeat protein [Thecamonas trahens ATCC 50062]KNC49354.1 TPR repeat protein [Thecamonas trahens ATCC 50062]|eukprot:XP_013757780.1 TPR repeat protein [Thecamonas trahens ATCC 50062]
MGALGRGFQWSLTRSSSASSSDDKLRAFYEAFDPSAEVSPSTGHAAAPHSHSHATDPPALSPAVSDVMGKVVEASLGDPPAELCDLDMSLEAMSTGEAAELGAALVAHVTPPPPVDPPMARVVLTQAVTVLEHALEDANASDDAAYLAGLLHAGAHPAVAANAGDVPGLRPGRGAALLKSLATRGHPWAQFGLAQLLREGKGVKVNPAAALALLELAAKAGVAPALHNLATMHAAGEGTPAAPQRAKELWEEAVEAGDPLAAFALSQALDAETETNDGIHPRTPALLRAAADAGLARAAHNLGTLHFMGKGGVPHSFKTAFQLFEAAASGGVVGAMVNAGHMLAEGKGLGHRRRRSC